MAFGVYIHIPYCIQRCSYCDFATYEQFSILPPSEYLKLLFGEMHQKAVAVGPRPLDTVYFGGGTPSLIPAENIISCLQELKSLGFPLQKGAEVTLEINPATIDEKKMQTYLAGGVNRFSVGAQSFKDQHLKNIGREHSSQQTRSTLALLKKFDVNYSFDLLFALPHQSLEDLRLDLDEVEAFRPNHVSPYCLTVPEKHKLTANRPSEDAQIEMFDLIHQRLTSMGYQQYEISNYCLPGFESRHNQLYWNDDEYWGIGLSAHSYLHKSKWGTRFWNLPAIEAYQKQVLAADKSMDFQKHLKVDQHETLEVHQALTDYCHISLRQRTGLSGEKFSKKFSPELWKKLGGPLAKLQADGLLKNTEDRWSLTDEGIVLSNQVFKDLTFLKGEIPEAFT